LRNKIIFMLLLIFSIASFPAEENTQITKKTFLHHLYHKHIINVENITLFQSVKNYSVLNNTTYLFLDYFITKYDEIFISGGYSFNDGLNNRFDKDNIPYYPYGGDTKSSVENINGSNRDYLLEIWYGRTIGKVSFSAGLIDLAGFVDINKYANSETEDFMNSVFVNNPVAYIPSYNLGFLLNYKAEKNLRLKFAFSDYEPEDGNYLSFEADFLAENFNIRPYYYRVTGSNIEGIGLSSDFTYENLGLFLRLGSSLVGNTNHFSTGIQYKISRYDVVGIGYSSTKEIKEIPVIESYYKKIFTENIHISVDIQYIDNRYVYSVRGHLSL